MIFYLLSLTTNIVDFRKKGRNQDFVLINSGLLCVFLIHITMSAIIGNGVQILPSLMPNAGNGLFADRDFKKNELITEYDGPRIDKASADKLREKHMHTHIRVVNSQYEYIDGYKDVLVGKGGGSFANDATIQKQNNSIYFSKFDELRGRGRVFLKATKDIKKGEEIYVSYGKDYWRSFEAE